MSSRAVVVGSGGNRPFLSHMKIVGLGIAAVLLVTCLMWYAALTTGDSEVRKALIAVAGSLTATLFGLVCGMASASWSNWLQRSREQDAATITALREVSETIDAYRRQRTEAQVWGAACRDPEGSPGARAEAGSYFIAATANTYSARTQALSALSKAEEHRLSSAVRDSLTALKPSIEAMWSMGQEPNTAQEDVALKTLKDEIARLRAG